MGKPKPFHSVDEKGPGAFPVVPNPPTPGSLSFVSSSASKTRYWVVILHLISCHVHGAGLKPNELI